MKATRPFLGGRCLFCPLPVAWVGVDESGPGEHGWVHLSTFDGEEVLSDHGPVVFAPGVGGVAA